MAAPDRNLAVDARNYSAASAAGRPRLLAADRHERYAAAANRRTIRLTPRQGSLQKFFDGREKLAQHDRLGDIAVAPAVERLTLVARHRKGGDRDDRDALRLSVALELAHRFQPRHIGQLN